MFNFSAHQRIGHKGEKWAFHELKARGYEVKFDPDFCREGYDLVVNGLPTEIKFAHQTWRKRKRVNRNGLVTEHWYPRWQWQIHPTSRRLTDWLLILVADVEGQRYTYVVPGAMVSNRTHIQLTSPPTKYTGWLAQWLNRWEIIEYLANGVYRNGGPLFHEWERIAA